MEVAMRGRKLSFLGAMVVAIAVAFVVSPSVAGQAGPATSKAASASALPRTPDGHPDLQGIYEIATITPIERPATVNGRLALTEKEAAALARAEQTRVETAAQPSAVDRGSPAIGARVGGYNNFWIARGSQAIIDPPDGKIPAFTAEARQRNANSRFRNNPSADAAETAVALDPRAYDDPEQRPLGERCLLGFGSTSGPPTLPNYFYNNLKQIVQTPDTILIQVEMVHDARLIRMNAQHLPPTIHRWMGDSVGHWEGDTLVVDTTNFTDKTRFRGSSENLHVVERIWRVDDKTLMYRFTVDDPTTWVKPWTGEYPWPATDEHMFEYACHEGNYALGDILRGARGIEAEEAAAAAAKKTSSR
jgi:hypothetical protein